MMHVVLHEPEIPQNTGNIVRTCKSTGSVLHLIEPLGFVIEDKKLKRAGLDYWHDMDIRIYSNFQDFCSANPNARLWLAETSGNVQYDLAEYNDGDYLLFGKETAGLPPDIRERYSDRCVRVPMVKDNRSLNLSNTVAIVLYEALRQNGFLGLA
jgi:tRNA (cytidine/uridine-2'-O-)-methyltransferase